MALKRNKVISEQDTYTYCFRLSEIISFFEEKIDKILEHIKECNKINIKIEDSSYDLISALCKIYKDAGWNVSYTYSSPISVDSDYKEHDYYILTFN